MQILNNSTNNAIFYTRVVNRNLNEIGSIDSQIKKAKSYAVSKGLNLEEILINL